MQYNDVFRQEEILWYHKLLEQRVKLGDKEQHTQKVAGRKHNKIQGLFSWEWSVEHMRCHSKLRLLIITRDLLFREDPSTNHAMRCSLFLSIIPHVSDACRESFSDPVGFDEVRKVVLVWYPPTTTRLLAQIVSNLFFKHFWRVIGTDLWGHVQTAFYWLQWLFLYETVLVNRMRVYWWAYIALFRAALSRSKGTTNNAISTQDVVHTTHKIPL